MADLAPYLVGALSLFVWIFLDTTVLAFGTRLREYCKTEEFHATCGRNEVIVMQSAKYGRMKLGRCTQVNFGYIGCSADVKAYMDRLCSGRRTCQIANIPAALDKTNPCSGDLTAYLEAAYTCVQTANTRQECQAPRSVYAPLAPGYLANVVTEETGCGDQYHPWIIQVQPTQRINLTLLDFGSENDLMGSLTGYRPHCLQYALVTEQGRNNDYEICAGNTQEKHVYLSSGSKVEIYLSTPAQTGGRYFTIKYDAVGCSEPDYPSYMWIKRDRDHVTIGCHNVHMSWRLDCEGGTWQGHIGNCTAGWSHVEVAPMEPENPVWEMLTHGTKGIYPFIIAGIAVFLVVILLVIALNCVEIKKKKVPTATLR